MVFQLNKHKTYVLSRNIIIEFVKYWDVAEKGEVSIEVEDERGSAKTRLPKPFDFSPES